MTRIYAEINEALKGEDWVLTNGSSQGKENLYLPATKFNQILGKYKGGGLGYGMPASLGAALAHKGSGKFCLNIQPDGDLLFTVSSIWTAVHHQIPLLSIVCSNRSYFNDEEHQERVAIQRNRPVENKTIGIRIEDPNVDFGAMARTYGCWGAGPITEPKDLIKTLARSGESGEEREAGAGGCGVPDAVSQFDKDLFSEGLSRVKRSTEPWYFLGQDNFGFVRFATRISAAPRCTTSASSFRSRCGGADSGFSLNRARKRRSHRG